MYDHNIILTKCTATPLPPAYFETLGQYEISKTEYHGIKTSV